MFETLSSAIEFYTTFTAVGFVFAFIISLLKF